MIIERTHYYAKPGRRDAVLATRRKACAVRVEIGLQAGSIYVKSDPSADGPDVAWQGTFASEEEHRADLDARAKSPAFGAVRTEMRGNIDRFERLFETRAPHADGWSGDVAVNSIAATPAEHQFESQDRRLFGYLWAPPGPGPFPCVIYNHGSGLKEPHDDTAVPALPVLLASWGLASFFPHRHGYAKSPGPDWRSECPAPEFTPAYNRQLVSRLEREAQDVLAARKYAAGLPAVDARRIAVVGSSFGGVNALLAASLDPAFRCAVDFAGAAMNWDRNPIIAARLIEAAEALTQPIFLAQAANDFSIRPTKELAAALQAAGKLHEAKIYPAFGHTPMEGHLLAGRGSLLWGPDVRRFFERWLG